MFKKVGMIGGKHSILPFKGIGIDVFPVTTIRQAKEAIEWMEEEYAVIFITERLAQVLKSDLARFDECQTPAIIPIPSSSGHVGIGMKRIQENVEKAIGMNILDNE